MDLEYLGLLAKEWEEEARQLRDRYGDERGARLCDTHAAELRARIREHLDEPLTLKEAAAESGYSVSHLQHLVADGEIPNAGEKGRPRIRRGDVPMKGRGSGESTAHNDPHTSSCSEQQTPERAAGEILSRLNEG